MIKFKEYDVVYSTCWINNLPPNTKGVIMLNYEDSEDYEVEFVDENGDTIDFFTVSGMCLDYHQHNASDGTVL